MPGFRQRLTALLLALCVGGASGSWAAEAASDPRVERLKAYVKTYGYLRFFHPGDEAADLDWDTFAAWGANGLLAAPEADLATRLGELFGPVAPTATFHRGAAAGSVRVDELRDLIEQATGQTTAGDEVVAWQHQGVGLSLGGTTYSSVRTGRENRRAVDGAAFSTVTQSIDPELVQGRRVRLSFSARVGGRRSKGQGWLRVDLPNGTGFFDNMRDRPVTGETWSRHTIEGDVAETARAVLFGFMLTAGERAWVDDVVLEVAEGSGWSVVPIANGSFEQSTGEARAWSRGNSPGYLHAIDINAAEGERCLRIERQTIRIDNLFDAQPELGEMLDVSLGAGVRLRAPLALPGDIEAHETEALSKLSEALEGRYEAGFDAGRLADRVGSVAIAWNVFQHFYPYFDQVPTEWEAVLDEAIERTLVDADRATHHETLRWLVAQLHDGHGYVYDGLQTQSVLPLRFVEAEGRVFVLGVRSELAPDVRPLDEVVTLGGRPIRDVLEERVALSSGSTHWRRARAIYGLVLGPIGESERLGLIRDGESLEVSVPYGRQGPTLDLPEPIEEMDDGVFYVDLGRADWSALQVRLQDLVSASGVVFDLRGYPRGNHAILQHLTDQTLHSAKWHVPQAVYPDRRDLVGYDTSGRWTLEPAEPRIGGRVVFVTGPNAISYAESVMAIVKHYELGEIVGSATAGTNGNVNPFELPGAFTVSWTGMRVLNHDDSQHHLLGVEPTVPANRTAAGVLAGRDEVLEVALALAAGRGSS